MYVTPLITTVTQGYQVVDILSCLPRESSLLDMIAMHS